MPRIGGKPKATPAVPLTTALLGDPAVPVNPFAPADPLAAARAASKEATLDSLQRAKRRIRNPTGRIRRAKFLTEVEVLRMQGFKPQDTAEILGCSFQQVSLALRQVRENAGIIDQLDRIDKIAIPLAVDNAIVGILNGDKEYSLRALDGRGIFRTHKSIEAQVTKTVLEMRVSITMPDHLVGRDLPVPRAGSIVGAPVTIDAELVPERAALPAPRLVPTMAGGAVVGVPDLT